MQGPSGPLWPAKTYNSGLCVTSPSGLAAQGPSKQMRVTGGRYRPAACISAFPHLSVGFSSTQEDIRGSLGTDRGASQNARVLSKTVELRCALGQKALTPLSSVTWVSCSPMNRLLVLKNNALLLELT